jgi:hypothetical protein
MNTETKTTGKGKRQAGDKALEQVPGTPEHMKVAVPQAVVAGNFVPLAKDYAITCKVPLEVATGFIERADVIIKGHKALGGAYLNLCKFARDSALNAQQVREMLLGLDFKPERISEIIKVVTCAPQLWKEVEARSIGFREALQLARGTVTGEAMGLSKDEVDAIDGETAEDQGASNQHGVRKKAKSLSVRLTEMAKAMLKAAERGNLTLKEPRVWDKLGNGYVLTLSQVPVVATEKTSAAK